MVLPTTESSSPRSGQPVWALILEFVGLAAHLFVGSFYLAAGLVAPLYGIVILWVVWAALLGVAIWWLRRHRNRFSRHSASSVGSRLRTGSASVIKPLYAANRAAAHPGLRSPSI